MKQIGGKKEAFEKAKLEDNPFSCLLGIAKVYLNTCHW